MIEQLLGRGRGSRRHQLGLAAGLVAIGLALTGCGRPATVGTPADGDIVDVLTPSAVYLQSGVDREAAGDRLDSLRQAIDGLRKDTQSGWTGRQDDVTGYLTELSGGRYAATPGDDADTVVTSLMDAHGPALFGVSGADLDLGDPLTTTGIATATIRATQTVRGVPVLDGELAFTIGDPDNQPRVHGVRGRVFPGLDVATTAQTSAEDATRTAERLSEGTVDATPTLVVLPTGTGVLAWQVSVTGAVEESGLPARSAIYFIDATTGELADTRAAEVMGHALGTAGAVSRVARIAPMATVRRVRVTGKDPQGNKISAEGIRTDRGVQLVDTTVPSFDPKTGDGAIVTYTARNTKKYEDLPGAVYTQRNGTRITDSEAIAAHAFSRKVYDYYQSLGWNSWDGKGTTLASAVNFNDGKYCNAQFVQPPGMMIYGNPCTESKKGNVQFVTIDIAGHEITHGVTDSSAGLIYSGQSGALNESFSDYFGNVIGNTVKKRDDSHFDEDGCAAVSGPTRLCRPAPDGTLISRYMLNGATFDDYLGLLAMPLKLLLIDIDQDNGGVHFNSSIWNHSLWSIRTQLAKSEGTPMVKSKLVKSFDRIVFHTLTTQLVATSGFLDARSAIEDTIVASGGNATIGSIARRTFDANGICEKCTGNQGLLGTPVATGGATQVAPAVNGNREVWLELAGAACTPVSATSGGPPSAMADLAETFEVAFAGDAVVAIEERVDGAFVVRYPRNGKKKDLGSATRSTVVAGLGGSDEGAAWSMAEEESVFFVDDKGAGTRTRLDIGDDTVTAISTGEGTVGLGTKEGRVLLWTPGEDVVRLGEMDSGVRVTATYGERVLAIDEEGNARLFDTDAAATTLSKYAAPFGAAMSEDYVIWTQKVDLLRSSLAQTFGIQFVDTDLYMYSFKTDQVRPVLKQRGQQGFPSLSGLRVVWQETGQGGDDIRSATLQDNL